MTIGVFGGTFNPPHIGHLIVAEHAREHLHLDRVVFMPAALSPHKQGEQILEGHHRLEMLRLAVRGSAAFVVSDAEVRRGGVSFTVDTLEQLRREHPEARLVLLIGADNLAEFHLWRDPGRVLELADVVALTRPGFGPEGMDERLRREITICQVPLIGVSASQIRRRVREGRSIRYLVPREVEKYIAAHLLYR